MLIPHLNDPEIQKEHLKQTAEPRKAFEVATNMKIGMRNQHQVQKNNKTLISASVYTIQYPPSIQSLSGHSKIFSTRKATVLLSIVRIVVKIGFLSIGTNAGQNQQQLLFVGPLR